MKINSKPKIPLIDGKSYFLQLRAERLTHQSRVSGFKKGPHTFRRTDAPARPSLMLLEIVLPVFTVYEVYQTLKSNMLPRRNPLIFMTAMHNGADELQRFNLSGMDVHLLGLLTAIPDANDIMLPGYYCKDPLPQEQVVSVNQQSSGNHFTLVVLDIFVANHKFPEPAQKTIR